ncbi:RyR domain-containing protein [Asaia prunellae]|uniref:RyR domain-containing protein n=1 Tax=Asaia prunellae TaxID=610245 RepID=UPI00047111B5|nr:RyR domain-containing protein [Asaia prunellae]
MNIQKIAFVCHEVNRALCLAHGDKSQAPWSEAPEWQKASAISGVEFVISHPDARPSDSHKSWLAVKEADGWIYGPVKDVAKKEHPCMVPYEALPSEQKVKDHLFLAVVRSLETEIAK